MHAQAEKGCGGGCGYVSFIHLLSNDIIVTLKSSKSYL